MVQTAPDEVVGERDHGEHGDEAPHGDEGEPEAPFRFLYGEGLVGGEGHHEDAVGKTHDDPDANEPCEGSLVGLEGQGAGDAGA